MNRISDGDGAVRAGEVKRTTTNISLRWMNSLRLEMREPDHIALKY